MKIPDTKPLILCTLLLLLASGCGSDNPKSSLGTGDPGDSLDWPDVTSQTRPWSRWWWMGSILDKKDLATEMEKYATAGLGGLEITPIYGVKGREDQFIPYLNADWMDAFEFTLEQADRLGAAHPRIHRLDGPPRRSFVPCALLIALLAGLGGLARLLGWI